MYLENEYIKIMLLPELGGRVHSASDKTNDYYFVYHNEVIKPALVGLTGPWISGGIEFNWPQHHRPSTFGSTDHRIEKHDNYIEIALDYAHTGCFEEAVDLLSEAPQSYPMVSYYTGWIELQRGETEAATLSFQRAEKASPDYCFPNRMECVLALETSISLDSNAAKAPYYSGNLWYSRRQYDDAI